MYECGALNDYSRGAEVYAVKTYEAIRGRKTDCDNIVCNTGFSIEQVQMIKNYIFYDKHVLRRGFNRFEPDICIVQFWSRLAERVGRNIRVCDIVLLRHELHEMSLLLNNSSMLQDEAHVFASHLYDYEKSVQSKEGNKLWIK